jgi:hypothetical protein
VNPELQVQTERVEPLVNPEHLVQTERVEPLVLMVHQENRVPLVRMVLLGLAE